MSDVQRRAEEAKALLANETLQAALDDIAEGLITQWRGTASGSTTLREQIAAEVRAVDAVRAKLKAWVGQGTYETAQIARLERRRAAQ